MTHVRLPNDFSELGFPASGDTAVNAGFFHCSGAISTAPHRLSMVLASWAGELRSEVIHDGDG